MKLRSVTYALFIAGLAAFSTSSLAAQSLRFGYETSQPTRNILRRKNSMIYCRREPKAS